YKLHKKIILGHLSGTNNHPDLALQTVNSVLHENNIVQQEDIFLTMASRHAPSNLIEI
ncbi:MBL fold metallo-hydrolase, partial [Clostridium perfringens]|nr:MBL fold metallo-hydrolase [Clostridium perfringens]